MKSQQCGFSRQLSDKMTKFTALPPNSLGKAWPSCASTCKCYGWTSCPDADTTVDSLCTDTCRCQGWGADSVDIVQHIHIHTAPHPTAAQQDTTNCLLDLHTGIHLMKTQKSNQIFSSTFFCLNIWFVAHRWFHELPKSEIRSLEEF